MNKKHRILLIVVPFVLLIFGYVGYVELSDGSSEEPIKAEDVEKIYVKPTKTQEAYENKLAMKKSLQKVEQEMEREKKAVSDPSKFFDKARGMTTDEEEVEPDEVKEESVSKEVVNEKVDREVVYVPVRTVAKEPDASQPTVAESKPKRRRKTGFSASSTSSSTAATSTESVNNGKNELVAVVHRDVKAQTNDVVKLRTLQDAVVNGRNIPANTIIDGIARVDANSGRVYLNVNGFSINGSHVEQKLEAYSISGGRGLEVNIDLTKGAARSIVGDVVGNTGSRIAIPGVKKRTIAGTAERKIEDPAADIPSGTKVFLR